MKVGDKVIHKLYPQFFGQLVKLDENSATVKFKDSHYREFYIHPAQLEQYNE